MGHVCSGSAAAHHKSFGLQLIVRQQYNRSRDSQLFRRISRRRKLLARMESARQDRVAQAQVDLTEQGAVVFRKWYQRQHRKWIF